MKKRTQHNPPLRRAASVASVMGNSRIRAYTGRGTNWRSSCFFCFLFGGGGGRGLRKREEAEAGGGEPATREREKKKHALPLPSLSLPLTSSSPYTSTKRAEDVGRPSLRQNAVKTSGLASRGVQCFWSAVDAIVFFFLSLFFFSVSARSRTTKEEREGGRERWAPLPATRTTPALLRHGSAAPRAHAPPIRGKRSSPPAGRLGLERERGGGAEFAVEREPAAKTKPAPLPSPGASSDPLSRPGAWPVT
jgi:hypothetical protein